MVSLSPLAEFSPSRFVRSYDELVIVVVIALIAGTRV